MIRDVAKRLGVQRGSRYVKATGEKRPRVLEQAITRRAAFDEALDRYGPLKPGDAAISRGRLCTVVEIDYEADTCKLAFEVGGDKGERHAALWLGFLRSYEHMGRAELVCSGGCACADDVIYALKLSSLPLIPASRPLPLPLIPSLPLRCP